MKTGQQQWTVDKVSAEYKPLMSPGASTILVRDYDKKCILKAFDMKTGQEQWTEKVSINFKPRISPDGSTVLVRDYDKNSILKACPMRTRRHLQDGDAAIDLSSDTAVSYWIRMIEDEEYQDARAGGGVGGGGGDAGGGGDGGGG